jgi:hypothetical protein
VIARPLALGRALRRTPEAPRSVAALLQGQEGYRAFRAIVRELFPEAEAEILAAEAPGDRRETAPVYAFINQVEATWFPIYEVDEYDQVAFGIPFVRNGWDYERFHALDLRSGELLVFALCAQPYEADTRVSLLDAAETHVPRAVLSEVPAGGFTPAELHERLDGTPYAAAADYADWLWGETETVFLDVDEEMVADIEWTRENVLELADQWRRAREILGRIGDLTAWLESDPSAHFAHLLDAALGSDAHLTYLRMRRRYACEITEQGLVPIPFDEPDPLPVPLPQPMDAPA